MTNNHKITIVSQMQVNSLAQQILATFQLGIDKDNSLCKSKDIYNQYVYQCQEQLALYSFI